MMAPRLQLNALTGIRGFAAWWVVLYHVRQELAAHMPPAFAAFSQAVLDPGFTGVDLFFILSGFIISYNYKARFHTFDFGTYKSFLWMRLARIYPVHGATLVFLLFLFALGRIAQVPTNSSLAEWTPVTFFENLLLIQQWSLAPRAGWNLPSWSISCEWLAYLSFPLLAQIQLKRQPALLISFGLLASLSYLGGATNYTGEIRGTPAGLLRIGVEFAAGTLLHCAFREAPLRWGTFAAALGLTGGGVFLLANWIWPSLPDCWIVPWYGVLVYGLAFQRGRVARAFSSRVALYWGGVSYSLYLTHSPVATVLGKVLPLGGAWRSEWAFAAVAILWIALFAVAGALTYSYIEKPARELMRTWRPRRLPSPPEFRSTSFVDHVSSKRCSSGTPQ